MINIRLDYLLLDERMKLKDLAEATGPILMIDIGTNGEIVLARGGDFWAASTAAGPAFEGARISCGMRATQGAVEKVVFNEDIHYNVIGNNNGPELMRHPEIVTLGEK